MVGREEEDEWEGEEGLNIEDVVSIFLNKLTSIEHGRYIGESCIGRE